jgi:hypothetical protein
LIWFSRRDPKLPFSNVRYGTIRHDLNQRESVSERLAHGLVVDQAQHSPPFYSIEGMHDVTVIEYGQQTLQGLRFIARSRVNVFPKDAPGVLYGPQKRVLVGGTHEGVLLH